MCNKKLISVIVPIYNTESYLKECLESILNNEFDIEVICINDGSTDNSENIVKEFQTEDKRVKYHYQTNKGLANARNKGVDLATNEFIIFVDSDDVIHESLISILVHLQSKNKYDIILYNKTRIPFSEQNDLIIKDTTSKNLLLENILKLEISTSVCLGIIKKRILTQNSILFPDGKTYEDLSTLYKIIYFSKKVLKINNKLYYHRFTPNSITSEYKLKNIDDILFSLEDFVAFIKKYKFNNYRFYYCVRITNISALIISFFKNGKANLVCLKRFFSLLGNTKVFSIIPDQVKYIILVNIKNNIPNAYEELRKLYFFEKIKHDSNNLTSIENFKISNYVKYINNNSISNLFFWGRNVISDSLLNYLEKKSMPFKGYIIDNSSKPKSDSLPLINVEDLNFDESFTVFVFSFHHSYQMKYNIISNKRFNKCIHSVITFDDFLTAKIFNLK